ncbi:MAG: helix-turn-helix transcriptional regulator [Cognatishimia sp.]
MSPHRKVAGFLLRGQNSRMTCILQKWQHKFAQAETSVIQPDGCRDLILVERPNRAPVWTLSALQLGPVTAHVAKNIRLTGFRLSPGSQVPKGLLQELPHALHLAEAEIRRSVICNARNDEMIMAISTAQTVGAAAKHCGVSARSLQRAMVRETGRAPAFWQRLARARRAAVRVDQPLADVAADCGFSDQAHMSREFRHWFGVSPRALRRLTQMKAQFAQPALATGEQISTK